MKNLKKVLSVALTGAMAFSLFACSVDDVNDAVDSAANELGAEASDLVDQAVAGASEFASQAQEVLDGTTYMTHDQYIAADLDTEVTVLCMVQATQSWWDNKITVYAADFDGAYFIYNMACSEEESADLVPGAVILVNGYKSEWSGEIEITDATFTLIPEISGQTVAPVDLTSDFGDEDALIERQNEFFKMTDLTVEAIGDNDEAFLYSWDGSGSSGDDLYFRVSNGDASATFTVESYLTGADTAVYQAVEGLSVGDTIDVEGFLYWYEGANPHITSVTVH